jgi:hypothetical protein
VLVAVLLVDCRRPYQQDYNGQDFNNNTSYWEAVCRPHLSYTFSDANDALANYDNGQKRKPLVHVALFEAEHSPK